MSTMTRKLLAILLGLALLLGGAGAALADDEDDNDKEKSDRKDKAGRSHDEDDDDDDRRPKLKEKGGRLLLHNDHIAVWFHAGKDKAKPDLRVAFNGTEDDEKSGYRVKIVRLYEAPADDPRFRGSYPKINLAKSDDWNVRTEVANESVTLTMVRAEAQGIVTLVWHIDGRNATVKYDVKVDNWRWANESNKLVLDMRIEGKNLKNATGANVTVEESGYVQWETTAQATYGVNDTRTIGVESYRHEKNDDDEDDDDDRRKGSHILLVFNGTGGYSALDYDPTFGVYGVGMTERTVPNLGSLVFVAGGFAVAVLAIRRRLA